MSALFDLEQTTARLRPMHIGFPELSKKEPAAQLKAEIAEKYAKLRAGELQGRDWVEDELVFRDERDALAQVPANGIKPEPDDVKLWRGVRSGPGWQIRPFHDWETKTTAGRIGLGRKFKSMQTAVGNGKFFEKPVIFFVVGSVVAMGNNRTVRVEGAVDLHSTGIFPSTVRLMRMGLWQDAIIERDDRHYIRAVMWLCQRDLAAGKEINQVINTGWEGKKLMLVCNAPKSDGGWPWLGIIGPIDPTGDEIAGYSEVGRAVDLKTRRAIMQREEFFGKLRSIFENLVFAGQTCNRYLDDVQAMQKVLPALSIAEICDAIRQITPRVFDEGMTQRAVELARKKYYGAKLTALFKLHREAAMSKTSMASIMGFAPTTVKPAQVEPPTVQDAAEAASAYSDDIETGTAE
jgi:hypothetical protein